MPLTAWARIAATCALLAGGCAPARTPPAVVPALASTHANPSDFVAVTNSTGVDVFDWTAGRLVYHVPNAVASPDWSRLFVSEPRSDHVTLDQLDGRTGSKLASIDVPGGLVASAVSTDGRFVALSRPSAGLSAQRAGPEQSRIVVADASGANEPRAFDLRGNYEPDAFSSDNQQLFLLEYQPAQAPTTYRVRRLDLQTGTVSALLSRSKLALPEETMRGTRHSHVFSPDGYTLYTLYANQPEHLHSRDLAAGLSQSTGETHAFVHVLNLLEGWAYCLDLPQPIGIAPASAHALALSPDGRALYVADRSTGKIVVADTNQLMITATADLEVDGETTGGQAAAAVGPDGSVFLSRGSELLVIDPKTLRVERHLPLAGAPTGLGISVDGQRLFVSLDDRVLALDPRNGHELGEISATGTPHIAHVGQVTSR